MKFYYVYKALMHFETNGYVTPYDLNERLMHVHEAAERVGTGITWLCDTMDNSTKHALGNAPNSEYIVGPDGRIVERFAWSDPARLRKSLERLVGPSERVTEVAELNMKFEPPAKGAATGVVPRLKLTGRFEPLQFKPQPSKEPFYVKLRAEANRKLLKEGEGQLYLGFFPDPLYHVHWNNLAPPLSLSIDKNGGVTVTPSTLTAEKVEQAADVDPREFLFDVRLDRDLVTNGDIAVRKPVSFRVNVDYYACHDDDAWCKRITQSYDVIMEIDPDGGWVQWRRRAERQANQEGGSSDDPMAPDGTKPNEKGRGQAPPSRPRPEGVVVDVDVESNRLTVLTRNGVERTVDVAQAATISLNGEAAELSKLRKGDRVTMKLERNPQTNSPHLTAIEAMRRD